MSTLSGVLSDTPFDLAFDTSTHAAPRHPRRLVGWTGGRGLSAMSCTVSDASSGLAPPRASCRRSPAARSDATMTAALASHRLPVSIADPVSDGTLRCTTCSDPWRRISGSLHEPVRSSPVIQSRLRGRFPCGSAVRFLLSFADSRLARAAQGGWPRGSRASWQATRELESRTARFTAHALRNGPDRRVRDRRLVAAPHRPGRPFPVEARPCPTAIMQEALPCPSHGMSRDWTRSRS